LLGLTEGKQGEVSDEEDDDEDGHASFFSRQRPNQAETLREEDASLFDQGLTCE